MRLYKYLAALALGATLSVPASAEANEIGRRRTFGLGVVAGYPGFGASLNIFFNEGMSLQIDPQLYAWRDVLWVGGRADLLFDPGRPLVSNSSFDLKWYIGPGLGFAFGLDTGYAVFVPEVPIGIGFQFSRVPIDLMLEVVPQFWIATYDTRGNSALDVWVSGALHARYYF
ncbi:MAG: hypothetical protein U0325_25330 [Polyangiales bacterium]